MIAALKQVEAACKVEDVAREVGVSKHTIYGVESQVRRTVKLTAQRLRQLEDENGRLKKLVADLSLDREMLKAVIAKKRAARFPARPRSLTRRWMLLRQPQENLGCNRLKCCV